VHLWVGKEGGRASHDAHLRRDETAPKMGHPVGAEFALETHANEAADIVCAFA